VAEPGRDPNIIREAVALFIACLVACVWATATIASTFFNRPLDTAVHAIMLAVVTAVLGTAGIAAWAGKRNGGNGA
jgi:hypothetical protein